MRSFIDRLIGYLEEKFEEFVSSDHFVPEKARAKK